MDIYFCHCHLIEENTISNYYYTHVLEIPTNKGANSYKLKLLQIGNILVEYFLPQLSVHIYI